LSAGDALAASCVGNCGTLGPDGVVTVAPVGNGSYNWISTSGGQTNGGTLPGVGGVAATNGSSFTTDAFSVAAGTTLSYWFNYVTSDGTASFPDYAWAELRDATGTTTIATILTARTVPGSGDTVPGFGMPGMTPGVTLTPATTAIIPGGPEWSPLGTSSGACWQGSGQGCGYTDWINSTFDILDAGIYTLVFGVANTGDEAFDSGLAFAGLAAGGTPIGVGNEVPLPGALPLFATGLAGMGWLVRRRKRKAVG
jgi:hypothetical protein